MKFSLSSTIINPESSDEFNDVITYININRLRTFFRIFIFIMLALFFIDYNWMKSGLWEENSGYRIVAVIHFLIFVNIIFSLAIDHYIAPINPKQINSAHYKYIKFFISTTMLGATLISINSNLIFVDGSGGQSTFITGCFAIASIFYLNPSFSFKIFVFNYLLLMTGTYLITDFNNKLLLAGIQGTIPVIFAGFLSVVLYNFRVRNFNDKKVIEFHKSQFESELEQARIMQEKFLPEANPEIPGYSIATYYKTATQVSGDYYDFFPQDNGDTYVITGDATGHGAPSGLLVSITKSCLMMMKPDSVEKLLMKLNETIKKIDLGRYKMALSIFLIRNNSIQYATAGMPPIYHYNSDTKSANEILENSVPLGSFKNVAYKKNILDIKNGDCLVIISDGFPEAENKNGEILGYDKVVNCIENYGHLSVDEIKEKLIELENSWRLTMPVKDDNTLVIIKKNHEN